MTVTLRPVTRPRIAGRPFVERPMRNKVLKVACARCARIDYLEETPETVEPVCFQGTLKGGGAKAVEVSFEELCGQCAKTVKGLLESIAKKIEGASPARKSGARKKKEEEPAGSTSSSGPLPGTVVQVEVPFKPTIGAPAHVSGMRGTIKTGS